jgi:serine/threonine protein kinase
MEPSSNNDERTILPGQLRSIAAGDRLRDWEIESFLGSGSFGTVWKARRSRLGGYQVAALKILDQVMVANVREQLIAEFTLLSSVEHPNLLRYLDAFEIEDGRLAGFVVFVLEVADTDLRNAIAQSASGLPENDMCAAFAQLADGLAAFHALGHSHGDIKPANILRVSNVWKLADFGITAPLDGSYSLVGGTTFDYCPPEELLGVVDPLDVAPEKGGRRVHRTADVWSLAISLHYAIAKRHPFPGDSVRARIASVVSDTKSFSPLLSPELRELLDKRCLTPSHQNRISAAELGASLLGLSSVEKATPSPVAVTSPDVSPSVAPKPNSDQAVPIALSTKPDSANEGERVVSRADRGQAPTLGLSIPSGVSPSLSLSTPNGSPRPVAPGEVSTLVDTPGAHSDDAVKPSNRVQIIPWRKITLGVLAIVLAAILAWKLLSNTSEPVPPTVTTDSLASDSTLGATVTTPTVPASDSTTTEFTSSDSLPADILVIDDSLPDSGAPTTVQPIENEPLGIPAMPS